MNITIYSVAAILILALIIVSIQQSRRQNDLSEWATAHSSLNGFFIFILMAGELFTTFSLLGHSGLAYSKGGAAFYLTAFDTIVYSSLYFIQPLIWQRSKELGAISQTEYYSRAFHSPLLGKIVTIVAALALIPYIAIQISGLAIIASELTHDALSPIMSSIWAIIGIVTYGIIGGIRGVVSLSLLKDFLMIIIIIVVSLYIPIHLYGSWSQILHKLDHQFPGFTTIGHIPGNGYVWFFTTSAIMCLGYTFWPHTFSSIFTASSAKALRRSQIFAPFYSFLFLPITIVGFAAKVNNPHMPPGQQDHALLDLAVKHLPQSVIIVIAVGGMLTALIPSTVMTISMAMNIIKTFASQENIVNRESGKINPMTSTPRNLSHTSALKHFLASEHNQHRIVKALVPIIAIIAAGFSLYGGDSIQALLVAGYGIISQLIIAFAIDLWQKRHPEHKPIPVPAIITGIIAGVSFAVLAGICGINYALLVHIMPDSLAQLNIGIIALAINIAVVSLLTILSRLLFWADNSNRKVLSQRS